MQLARYVSADMYVQAAISTVRGAVPTMGVVINVTHCSWIFIIQSVKKPSHVHETILLSITFTDQSPAVYE